MTTRKDTQKSGRDDKPTATDPSVAPSAPRVGVPLTSEGTGDAEFLGEWYHTVQRKGD